ncbi:MAG: DUF1294 domain-containing protein [Clostridia bacterium]|nr:DUF1294 domain-containing protein [Clostridia bacterium]
MTVYLSALTALSLVAFTLYFADKLKAKRGSWRIPEKVLLGIGFIGGAVGALAAMQLFRHKTKHYYFYLINILGLIWQIGAAVFIAIML